MLPNSFGTHGQSRGMTETIVTPNDLLLVTGAGGFVGSATVANLLNRGFRRLRCFVRPSGDLTTLKNVINQFDAADAVEIAPGNLLSKQDCLDATAGATVIFHLAAARGEKSFPAAYLNTVITTRNLLEAAAEQKALRRFVNVSSFAVYSNERKNGSKVLDESGALESDPRLRGEAYCFAKLRQEEMVRELGSKLGIPYVLLRPGWVYGPGNEAITSRVGLSTFGIFLHLGGNNRVPLSYVDNCADAIALAGLKPGVDGEVFNVVDDDLPTSREFLRSYKKEVRHFRSLFIPRPASYLLCLLWESYCDWSHDQLPRAYNRKVWRAYWSGATFTNKKLKDLLGWNPPIDTSEALRRYFDSCRGKLSCA